MTYDMTNTSRPLSIWMIVVIMIASGAALGAFLGYLGQTLGIGTGVRVALIAAFTSGLSVYLARRRRGGLERPRSE